MGFIFTTLTILFFIIGTTLFCRKNFEKLAEEILMYLFCAVGFAGILFLHCLIMNDNEIDVESKKVKLLQYNNKQYIRYNVDKDSVFFLAKGEKGNIHEYGVDKKNATFKKANKTYLEIKPIAYQTNLYGQLLFHKDTLIIDNSHYIFYLQK